jgi:late competence protein required for DNA uptake (superfamily II DNA/RNA helicase)
MKIIKKLKCNHCGSLIESHGKCSCGKVVLCENTIVEGKVGTDYIDLSPILLNE